MKSKLKLTAYFLAYLAYGWALLFIGMALETDSHGINMMLGITGLMIWLFPVFFLRD